MFARYSLALIVALVPLAASAETDDVSALKLFMQDYAVAFAQRDLPKMESLWKHSDAVVVTENGNPVFGWDDYYEDHLKPEVAGITDVRFDVHDLRINPGLDLAWIAFQYTAGFKAGDRQINSEGAGTLVAERTADGWAIVHTHMSGRRAPPPGAPAQH